MDHGVDSLPVRERILTLDIVRGFALLGILIMNMPGFSTSFWAEADGSHLWAQPWDQGAELVRDMLFSGKFNSMFSLLFGIGFTIQLGRLQARDPDHAIGIYVRRLIALLAFGLIHAMVFWTGDVLHIYALLGFLLLLLRRVSNRTVCVLIGLCLLYPAVSGTLRLLVMTPDIVQARVALMQAWEASNNAAYGHGSFLAAAAEHAREAMFFYDNPWNLWGTLGFYVQMTTTMLIGFLIGRNGWVRRIPELLPVIRRLQWWALGIGMACSLFFGIVGEMNRVPGPVADQDPDQHRLCREPRFADVVLRIDHHAPRAIAGVAADPRADGGSGADAADQLSDADGHRDDDLLWLGLRALGQGGSRRRARARVRDLLRDPGPAEPLVAAALRDGADGVGVALPHLRAPPRDGASRQERGNKHSLALFCRRRPLAA